MADTPYPPAPERGPVTYDEIWRLAEMEYSTARTLAEDFSRRADPYDAQGHKDKAAELRSIAFAKARRAEVYLKLCGLLDLILDDEPTRDRIKELAAAKRARRLADRDAAVAADALPAADGDQGEGEAS